MRCQRKGYFCSAKKNQNRKGSVEVNCKRAVSIVGLLRLLVIPGNAHTGLATHFHLMGLPKGKRMLARKENEIEEKTLPKALRTQALTALTKNFGFVGLVRWVWLGRFGLIGLVW